MPPLDIEIAKLAVRTGDKSSTGKAKRTRAWRVLGTEKNVTYSTRAVKFFDCPIPEDEDAKNPLGPRKPIKGDYAIIFKNSRQDEHSPGRAHLVPRHLLDHDGAVFCFDDSITDGNPWVQVLPRDRKGIVEPKPVAGCTWHLRDEGKVGDIIAVQAVPEDSPPPQDGGIQDFGIRITCILGKRYLLWEPLMVVHAVTDDDDDNGGTSPPHSDRDDSDDSDDSDDELSADVLALSNTYKQITPKTATPANVTDRTTKSIALTKQAIALSKEAEQLRRKTAPSTADTTDFANRAKAWSDGVLQFMEDGAPSPTAGPLAWIAAGNWVSGMAETPKPPDGWGNVPADYTPPETPVADGFGLVAAPADLVCLIGALAKSIHKVVKLSRDTTLDKPERTKLLISEFCTIGTYLGHMGVAGIGIADIAYNGWVVAEKAKLAGERLEDLEILAEQTGQHLNIAASVVGIVVGVYVTTRNSVKADKARRRMNKVHTLLTEVEGERDRNVAHEKALLEHFTFAEKKLRRKKYKTAFTATAAAIGTAGSSGGLVVAAIGSIALANAWNPVGWTIFGAGLAVGLGVTSYVLIRRFRRSKRHKHRVAVSRPVNARLYAINLAQAYLDPNFLDHQPEDWQYINRHLRAIGIKGKKLDALLSTPPDEQTLNKLVRHIERKMS
ncbi:MAG: hypothetical protein MI794_16310 [Pseudomonadales bacterium]|nr:hypothetical protein [Pseudomonadales bacterium]